MIFGVGTDICHIQRITESLEKFGERFTARILRADEIYGARITPAFLAKRYAAKEAVSKALGTGIGEKLSFQDIQIVREGNTPPKALIHKEGFENITIHLSISDEKEYAVAFAVAETSKS